MVNKPKSQAAKRRPIKKRSAWRKKRMLNVNKALTPFSQRFITKMKYSDTFTLQLSNNGTYYFNLNSVFDPNRTGIGHQPYGYDQLAALYNRYRVISCSYNITAYSGGSVVRVAAIPCNEIFTTTPSVSAACENPRSKWIIQIPGGNTKLLKGNVYMPSLVGRNKAQYMADDRFQAQVGSNPAEAGLLGIFGADIGDLSATIQCTITLNYVVEWFDVISLGQS